MDDGIPSSSSDSVMTSRKKKNLRATYKIQIKKYCLSLKAQYYAMFRNSFKKHSFVLKPLQAMLDHVMDRLSLQKLEYKMERIYLPYIYIF